MNLSNKSSVKFRTYGLNITSGPEVIPHSMLSFSYVTLQ